LVSSSTVPHAFKTDDVAMGLELFGSYWCSPVLRMCSIRESWAGALIIACRKQQLLPLLT